MTREVLAARNPALRVSADDLGLLIDGVAVRDIGGWEYLRIVPLGGKDRPPLPPWAAALAFRLVPALRRRIRQAVAAAARDVPMQLVRSWSSQWRPELAEGIATIRDTDLAALDDAGLDAHLRARWTCPSRASSSTSGCTAPWPWCSASWRSPAGSCSAGRTTTGGWPAGRDVDDLHLPVPSAVRAGVDRGRAPAAARARRAGGRRGDGPRGRCAVLR
jgi:hypothetical protein